MKRSTALIAFALMASCASATAQEPDLVTWKSPLGKFTYTSESGPSGVLEYPVPFGDNLGYLYVNGLAGEFGGPGPLKGYWSEPDVSHDDEDDTTLICPFAIIDDHGRTTRNWGQLIIAFTGDDFPTDFVLMRARCFEKPDEVINGKLMR
jgi:hypothetical protein